MSRGRRKPRGYFSNRCLELASPLTPKCIAAILLGHFGSLIFCAQCKGIQDTLELWIPHLRLRIPGTGFRPLSVDLGSGILDSLGCIPDSKPPGFQILRAKLPGFRNPDSLLTWGDILRSVPQCRTNYVSLRLRF